MASFFFPCAGLSAQIEAASFEAGSYTIHRRLWQTSTFDIATLASRHKLHFQWELMGALLSNVHSEIETRSEDHISATDDLRLLQTMLYVEGIAPFVAPLVVSHSINDYSGINSRDSDHPPANLPADLRSGITSKTAKVEAWINDPALLCLSLVGRRSIDRTAFEIAAAAATRWRSLENAQRTLFVARSALHGAPLIPQVAPSLLHLWQGIESLFPDVSAELAFRLSLLISQCAAPIAPRHDSYQLARRSYRSRSAAAHGAFDRVGDSEWSDAWHLLTMVIKAIHHRGGMPSEAELVAELLTRQ